MDEDFRDGLFDLVSHLLRPENLVVKKINGKDLKGAELLGFIEQYFQLFQSEKLPPAQSIYESTIEKQMMILIDSCLKRYKELVFKHQDIVTDVNQIPILHGNCKKEAILDFIEAKKMGGAEHLKKFKKILENQIERMYDKWSSQSSTNLAKMEQERERTRKAVEEKHKAELEQFQKEKEAAAKLSELEKLNAEQAIEREKYLVQKEIAEARLNAEKERSARIEAEKAREEAIRKALEKELEAEQWKTAYENKRTCNIL